MGEGCKLEAVSVGLVPAWVASAGVVSVAITPVVALGGTVGMAAGMAGFSG